MANRSVITSRGLQLLSKASAAGENSYWIGYYGLAYVPEENRGEHGEDYLTSSTDVLTKSGDYIYNVWQGSMTPTGFNTATSAASDLYNKCLYTSNIMARYRYVLDENGKNNLVMWRGTTDSSSYKLTGGAVYRGIGAEGEEGAEVTKSQMPIPAPLFYLGEPTRYDTPLDESGLIDAVKYPNVAEDFPMLNNLPSVSTDSRDYSASSKLTETPPTESYGGFGDYGSMSGATKYEWAAAKKTYTQDQDAQGDTPILEESNRYCQQYWKYQSISNFNRFHAPASAEGFSVDYEPACRNMSKVTKYFPISYYKVLNVEQGQSETASTDDKSTTATSLQLTVNLNLRDYNNIVANRTNTAEIVVEPGNESGIKDTDGNDLYKSRKTSLKFNRIGIYAVPMTIHRFSTEDEATSACDNSKVQFEVMGDAEPVLFAVADVDEVMVKEGGAIDNWSIEFVLNMTDATDEGAILRDTSIFYNMYEDDAITWYKNQLLATASLSESVINQGIEINYLRNQIAQLEGGSGDCMIDSSEDEWARKNHTHPYMKNIVDSEADGNGAVRGIFTQTENDSITVYNTAYKHSYSDSLKINGRDVTISNYGYYRFNSGVRSPVSSNITDTDLIATLKHLGVEKFQSIFGSYNGYVVCDDPDKDMGLTLSGSYTLYDEAHIYVRVNIPSDENKLGVIVVDKSNGSYVVYKNSEVGNLPNSNLHPQYLILMTYALGLLPSDTVFTMNNFVTGDYSMTLGKNSASGGKYNLNLSANGVLNVNSDYNLLLGGIDDDEPNSVHHISVDNSHHNIIMGNTLSSQICNTNSSLLLLRGGANRIGNRESTSSSIRSSMVAFSSNNDVESLDCVIGSIADDQNVKTASNSLLLSPGKVKYAVNSIVVGSGGFDYTTNGNSLNNAYSSILFNTGDYGIGSIGTSIIMNSTASRLFQNYQYDKIAKVLNHGYDINKQAGNSMMLGYSLQYGNMYGVIAPTYTVIGNLSPTEMVPMRGGSDVDPTFYGTVSNALLFGGTANGMTKGILGVSDSKTYFPSNSNGVVEIGDCTIDYTQRPSVDFITVDELNAKYGEQAPADGEWNGYDTIIYGTGELNLAKGNGSTFTKSVRGMCLYMTYTKSSYTWSDGYDLDHTDWTYYSKNVISPSNWSNLLFLGAGANAGADTENSIFIGKNSAWAKTTFVNSFINTLGSDGGVKYTKYASSSTAASTKGIVMPPTKFENVWWIGHNSPTGNGCDSTNGAFSIPVALANLHSDNSYSDLPKYSLPVFKDTFAFIGSNPNLFNHAYWYGVETTGAWKNSTEKCYQPANTPMIYTGGIALGGVGSHDANFGMLKLGCSRAQVSRQADLYKDYNQSLVTYSTPVSSETDPIQLIPCTYAGVTRQNMHSPHAGKCLIVQDLQELDGTLHIGLGYPTDTFGNPLYGAGSSKPEFAMTNQCTIQCSYAGSSGLQWTVYYQKEGEKCVKKSYTASCSVTIPEGQTSHTISTTLYDPELSIQFSATATLEHTSSYVFSCTMDAKIRPKDGIKYFLPGSYGSRTSNMSVGFEFTTASEANITSEVYLYSSGSGYDQKVTFNGFTFHGGGGMCPCTSTLYYPGAGTSAASTSSGYNYYYQLRSIKTLSGTTSDGGDYAEMSKGDGMSGSYPAGGGGSESWNPGYPLLVKQLVGSDSSSYNMILIK